MAKQQSFADKVAKASKDKVLSRAVRLVFSYKSEKNAWKFVDRMIHIPEGQNENEYINKIIKSKVASN